MGIGAVLGGAPTWAYALLAVLIVLGVRRLRPRETSVAVAVIPSIAFLVWSLIGARGLALSAGPGVAALAWLGGAALGWLSTRVVTEPPAIRLPGGRVRQPGTWLPLALYMMVFVARFACGAWAALDPERATIAVATGVAIGAAMTARLVAAVIGWLPVRPAPAEAPVAP